MEINLTLFVQMINFFIAWYLLRMLYFKPAISVLDQQQKHYERLRDTIAKWQGLVTQKEQEQQALWTMLKRFSKKNQPDIMQPELFLFKQITPLFEPAPIKAEQIDTLLPQVWQMIMTGAAHVDV